MSKPTMNAWRTRGYNDALSGRPQRAPLRDDDGESMREYLSGYRRGREARANAGVVRR